jgi:hypothetical protein
MKHKLQICDDEVLNKIQKLTSVTSMLPIVITLNGSLYVQDKDHYTL